MKQAVLIQCAPTLTRHNHTWHVEMIRKHAADGDLIVFPELSLNGYKMMDSVYEHAFTVRELENLAEASRDVEVIVGCALREGEKIYNAAVSLQGGAVKSIYRKRILPNYGMFEEMRYFFSGTEMGMYDGALGKTQVLICEDAWNSKVLDETIEQKPDVIVVISNSPARDFKEDGLLIEQQWEAILKTLAIMSGAHVLFVNRVGFEDGIGFWGGSRMVSPKGEVKACARLFEKEELVVKIDSNLSKTQKYILRH